MFEAVFILTALDAGTRVARFMVQDLLGNIYKPLGRTSWYPSVLLSSTLVVSAWGYFLYVGVIDPYGGVNILWPLFGMSNQMLAGIALCFSTAVLVKMGRAKYLWVTGVPLLWITIVTTAAAWQRLFSEDTRIGYIAAAQDWAAKLAAGTAENAAIAEKMVFNNYLVAGLTGFFLLVFWVVLLDTIRVCARFLQGKPTLPLAEAPYELTKLPA
jgi:carbon starvation protein